MPAAPTGWQALFQGFLQPSVWHVSSDGAAVPNYFLSVNPWLSQAFMVAAIAGGLCAVYLVAARQYRRCGWALPRAAGLAAVAMLLPLSWRFGPTALLDRGAVRPLAAWAEFAVLVVSIPALALVSAPFARKPPDTPRLRRTFTAGLWGRSGCEMNERLGRGQEGAPPGFGVLSADAAELREAVDFAEALRLGTPALWQRVQPTAGRGFLLWLEQWSEANLTEPRRAAAPATPSIPGRPSPTDLPSGVIRDALRGPLRVAPVRGGHVLGAGAVLAQDVAADVTGHTAVACSTSTSVRLTRTSTLLPTNWYGTL